MTPNTEVVELLRRVEDLIDALEVRGITSSKFYDLCSEIDACLKSLPAEKTLQAMDGGDTKSRLSSLINRLKKLEIFAGAQAGITTNLTDYIADTGK